MTPRTPGTWEFASHVIPACKVQEVDLSHTNKLRQEKHHVGKSSHHPWSDACDYALRERVNREREHHHRSKKLTIKEGDPR